ncbi:MAG: hypothetical protein KBC98_01365 [Candidatus Pacebacteria bacterium]|jgi:hypothetical protein|nr:hypothetical protein [Candidatus Paceibacterota bacterium]
MERIEELLEKNLELTKQNNEILRGIQRRERAGKTWRFLKFGIGIALLIAGYIYLQPYLKTLQEAYQSAREALNDVQAAGNSIKNFGN